MATPQTRTLKTYAEEGYAQNPIVNACINKIAEACSTVRVEVHTKSANKKIVANHPILGLLARPNPTQTWSDFIKEMASWHRIAGEVFVVRYPEKGEPQELYCLNPQAVSIKVNPNGSAIPLAYQYGFTDNKKTYAVSVLDGTSQVMHLKTFNPADPFRGLSPLKAAAYATDTHNNGASWNSNLLLNSARPSGVVELPGNPSETTISQFRQLFKKMWGGAQKAGDVMMLTGGAKFTALSINPKDMDFKESMNEAAKNIALVFGVPLPLVTMEAATFSNMEQAEESLWVDTVMPLLNALIGGLSNFLMPLYSRRANEVLTWNADAVPALEDRRERLFDRMVKGVAGGVVTPDEAREEMGFDTMGGNAEKLIVVGMVSLLDKVGEQSANDNQPVQDPVAPAKGEAR